MYYGYDQNQLIAHRATLPYTYTCTYTHTHTYAYTHIYQYTTHTELYTRLQCEPIPTDPPRHVP